MNKVLMVIFCALIHLIEARTKVGELHSKSSGVRGTVFILNENQIFLEGFTFRGDQNVVFMVGTGTSTPSYHNGKTIREVQASGDVDEYKQDIVLDLPKGITSSKVKWFAIFTDSVDAGDVIFPESSGTSAHEVLSVLSILVINHLLLWINL